MELKYIFYVESKHQKLFFGIKIIFEDVNCQYIGNGLQIAKYSHILKKMSICNSKKEF